MKIEPHENGPLFVEMNFYIRAAQPEKGENMLGIVLESYVLDFFYLLEFIGIQN